ncbi:hypothetical protein Poli38472_012195 [Pythium oligandrum]|uniref:Uncharacterized protein n=1 Tax=Pythium oligandrum TaxID=41045 RepID=A0A8K1FN92_PYTOL|nr:hypothetical protein Poli38472_012195 [Pythium oligandrum]|eukprot:TMW67079.1 hypothetical protein Poli38472_012195 [Pythium oligandrum]
MAASRGLRSFFYGALALSTSYKVAQGAEICDAVTQCRRNGGEMCIRSTGSCPPCIYSLNNEYTCFEKDSVTNTCPFTGVKYDCSTVWTSSANSTSSPSSNSSHSSGSNSSAGPHLGSVGTPDSPTTSTTTHSAETSSSNVPMYAGIGGGVLVVLLVAFFVINRRRQRNRQMPQFAMRDSPPPLSIKPGVSGKAPPSSGSSGYAPVLETTKGRYTRKHSDPAMLDGGRMSDTGYSGVTTVDSMDGMLTDHAMMPAVLGDPPASNRRGGIPRSFKRHNSGSSHGSSSYIEQQQIYQDVSARVTNSANVFDEYLKMKHEMNYDADETMSELDSERFSLASELTVGGDQGGIDPRDISMSLTESEYAEVENFQRSRGESECYSEMSYNDEKYSFSEELRESIASTKHGEREVEI